MYQNIWAICHNFLVLGRFVTIILFWTVCHKSYLSQFYFGRFVTSHICHHFFGRFVTSHVYRLFVLHDRPLFQRLLDDLSQITFVLDDMSQKGANCTNIIWTICHIF